MDLHTVAPELLAFKMVLKLQRPLTVLVETPSHPGIDIFPGAVGQQLGVGNEIDLDIGKPITNARHTGAGSNIQRSQTMDALK